MSREIIQFDQAMFESKLDAMVREKVERIVNAMPDASGERDRQRREIRAFRLMVADRWVGISRDYSWVPVGASWRNEGNR